MNTENKKITPIGPIPNEWKKTLLQEVSDFITKGATPTTYGFDWLESGIPFLRSECVSETGFSTKGLAFISKEANDVLDRSKVKPDDLLISITGNVGRVAIYPKYLLDGNINQHIARVRIQEQKRCDRKYIYYQLIRNAYRKYYDGIITGAAYPQLSLKQIRETPVYHPPLPTQRKIAAILSAYDDLIENNLKRIKLLEEKAQLTYEEWFVRMKFPGHETTPIDKETGLPEGWETVKLSDIGEFLNGYAFKPKDLGANGMPVIKIKEMKNGVVSDTPRNSGKEIPPKYIVNNGDILFSWSATLEVVVWSFETGLLNQHLFKVTPNESFGKSYVFLSTKNSLKIFDLLTTGATMKHIKRKELDFVKLNKPPEAIMKQFEEIAGSCIQNILSLSKQNQLLKEARDILLPRLMSGVIDVEELDLSWEI